MRSCKKKQEISRKLRTAKFHKVGGGDAVNVAGGLIKGKIGETMRKIREMRGNLMMRNYAENVEE